MFFRVKRQRERSRRRGSSYEYSDSEGETRTPSKQRRRKASSRHGKDKGSTRRSPRSRSRRDRGRVSDQRQRRRSRVLNSPSPRRSRRRAVRDSSRDERYRDRERRVRRTYNGSRSSLVRTAPAGTAGVVQSEMAGGSEASRRLRSTTPEVTADMVHGNSAGGALGDDSSLKLATMPAALTDVHQVEKNRSVTSNITCDNDGLKKILNSLVSVRPNSHTNVVPVFNPTLPGHRIDLWLHKVNQCATIYGWDDRQTIHFALQKLDGNARMWYDSLPDMLPTWKEWQDKLVLSFPFEQNYGKLLDDMLKRKPKIGEPIENYFYEKMSLLNQCKISGKFAVDCIIYGLQDRNLRTTAQSLGCTEPEQLLKFLSSSKEQYYVPSNRADSKIPTKFNNENFKSKTSQICFNCHERGHIVINCPKPITKCTICSKVGHLAEKCFKNKDNNNNKTKTTLQILQESNGQSKYYKNVLVNNENYTAFVDLGSEITILRASEVSKLKLVTESARVTNIKAFGNSLIPTLGQVTLQIIIDRVEGCVKAVVVDDNYINVPLLIGQDFSDQKHILVTKDSNSLNFHNVSDELPTYLGDDQDSDTIKVKCSRSCEANNVSEIDVYTEPRYGGRLYIQPSVVGTIGAEVVIRGGIYDFDNDGNGKLYITSGWDKPNKIKENITLARGMKFTYVTRECFSVEHIKGQNDLPLELINIGTKLESNDKMGLISLLNKYRDCFAMNLNELGCAKQGEMKIELHDSRPVVYRPYRLAYNERGIVRNMVNELLDADIIQESVSDYASPVILVKKNNGKFRLCVDFRALNNKTVKERYPMPIIDEQISRLAGGKYFTALDLASGYYQLRVAPESQHLTAFVTPDGQYEFKRMPFGLANAPAVFQRLINRVLGSSRYSDNVLTYMDDILIVSSTIEEGVNKLQKVLDFLREAGLTLNVEKCLFLAENIDYLGYDISSQGVRPSIRKIECVQKFPEPCNQHQVRQFYGLVSYFRKFIYNFASLAQPITLLLKKNAPFVWGAIQREAFEFLKQKLSERPILNIYDPNAKYTEIHTDASKHGLAGILMQKLDDSDSLKVVAYYSRQTSPQEKNFHAYELETLAVVESLKKFRVYVLGIQFKVITDCRALRTTLTKRDLIPRIARWWLQLQEFQFDIEYREGTKMCHVDALSRNPTVGPQGDDNSVVNEFFPNVMQIQSENWLLTLQLGDEEIRRTRDILNSKEKIEEIKSIKDNFVIEENQLFRYIDDDKKEKRWVVPKGARWQICKLNHDDIGHFAFEKTYDRIKKNYWFPKMRHFIKKYVKACLNCAYHGENNSSNEGFLNPIEKVPTPFHTLHIDHLGPFVRSKNGNTHLLVIVDSFTKYCFIKAVKDTKTKHVINILKDLFYMFRIPTRIICDRGSSFTSNSFTQFCSEKKIKLIHNAVACPRANGQVERYNRTILKSLSTQTHDLDERVWDEYVGIVQWGINNTLHKSIGKTPAELLFGVAMNCEVDGAFDQILETTRSQINVEDIRSEAIENISKAQNVQKLNYDKNRKSATVYKEGDLVKITKVSFDNDGKSKKLVNKYLGPFKVTKVIGNDRYRISNIDGFNNKTKRKYKATVAADRMRPWIHLAALDVQDE